MKASGCPSVDTGSAQRGRGVAYVCEFRAKFRLHDIPDPRP